MSRTPLEVSMMQAALDGLRNQSVDTLYAASLLPPIERVAWRRDHDALDAYYRGFRFEEYFDSNATKAMKACWRETKAWIAVQGQMCVKPPAQSRIFVQVLAAAGNVARYNALSPHEQNWFVEWSRTERYRDVDARLLKWLPQMGPVYVPMYEADRLQPFTDKVRDMTVEWLSYSLSRGNASAKAPPEDQPDPDAEAARRAREEARSERVQAKLQDYADRMGQWS